MALPETTLADLRTLARQFADMVGSSFVTDDELNRYINLGARQLYNKFVEVHGQEYFLRTHEIALEPPRTVYELPDDLVGVKGVDWSTSPAASSALEVTEGTFPSSYTRTTTAYEVPLDRSQEACELLPYAFGNRHEYQGAPSTQGYLARRGLSSLPRYRVLASKKQVTVVNQEGPQSDETTRVNLIRLSSEAQGYLLVWYWPEVPRLSLDTDAMPMFHGFDEYPAIIAAIMMLAKEESDTTALQIRKREVEQYITSVGGQRDVGAPEVVRDVGGW